MTSDSGGSKTGTGGGRVGVTGGAFSLSVVDSWLDSATVSGLGVGSASEATTSAGGLGNSLMICSCQKATLRESEVRVHYLIQPVQDVLQRLGPLGAAMDCQLCLSRPLRSYSRVQRAIFGGLEQYCFRCVELV